MGHFGEQRFPTAEDPTQEPSEIIAKPGRSNVLAWLTTAVSLGILAPYLAMVPLGQWQADEYDYFGRLKAGAGQAFLQRLRWSPRPISETLYLGYGLLANHFKVPLTGWFLGVLWAGFLVCASATALSSVDKARRLPFLMTGLALAAACITSGPLFQVFYWPAGAVAYLTALSATLLVLLQALDGRLSSPGGRTICCVALLVAALSSEMGAMFALSFAVIQAVIMAWGGACAEAGEHETRWWVLPGAASVVVLLWAATHRLPVSESAFVVQSDSLHRPFLSMASAGARLARELAGWSSGMKRPASALLITLSRVALAVGAAMVAGSRLTSADEQATPRHALLPLAATFLAASFLALFASYLHFGYAGGERYETLRRCWMIMAYIALAVVLRAELLCPPQLRLKLGPALLIAGVMLPWHLSPLSRQYSGYAAVRQAITENFQSGNAPGERMHYVVPQVNGVVTPAALLPGTYTRNPQSAEPTLPQYILTYFGKQELLVTDVGR